MASTLQFESCSSLASWSPRALGVGCSETQPLLYLSSTSLQTQGCRTYPQAPRVEREDAAPSFCQVSEELARRREEVLASVGSWCQALKARMRAARACHLWCVTMACDDDWFGNFASRQLLGSGSGFTNLVNLLIAVCRTISEVRCQSGSPGSITNLCACRLPNFPVHPTCLLQTAASNMLPQIPRIAP